MKALNKVWGKVAQWKVAGVIVFEQYGRRVEMYRRKRRQWWADYRQRR
jgi:hypothetical protein